MLRAWIRNKPERRIGVLASLLGVCVANAAAQQPAKPRPSPVPRMIILPAKVVSGTQATLAVLDSQGRLLPNVAVEFSGGQRVTTDTTGRAIFKAPDAQGPLVAKASDKGVTASTIVISAEDPAPQGKQEQPKKAVNVASYPHVMAIHDRFTLEGSGFQGAADSNHVYLYDDPCLVVASSSVSLVVLPGPHVPVGDVTLRVTVAGIDAGRFPVSTVLLEFSGPTESVNAGSDGKLILHAHGTTEPLTVEVRNGSPGVIQLARGNVQRLKTSGGEDNIAPVEVKFVSGGNYSVSARLVPAW
jgi:hypothetical protein